MKAIDVHGHYGLCNNHNRNLNDQFMDGSISDIIERAKKCNIEYTFVSSLQTLMPYGGDILSGNKDAYNEMLLSYNGIKFWCVLNPKIDIEGTFIYSMLQHKDCVGIKIHPTLHEYSLDQYGDKIFTFAMENDLIILTHTGCDTPPEDVARMSYKYPKVGVIMAHLGNSNNGDLTRQVRSLQKAHSNNIYIDTSSGCSIYSGLIEWAVKEIGSNKILFGSDTLLHSVACQKARIEFADIKEKDKENILYNNAKELFKEFI